ncbi:reverse transcriptase [Gossypium australe]|uniref:Reverse transcriptase n=1 Tax=Gossypium australe TaxID=47621 RepID=A0A5B6V8C6_9ROSI|nr:reverse transcriptase [Gossypium australe]
MIVNQFKHILEACIDRAQSVFVPGKLILDNVLPDYEILHTFRQKRIGKKMFITLKLDMSKAYDRVEWSFLREMMLRIGFHASWVENIMKCISTISYSVIVNGKGLSSLIRLALRDGLIKGAKVVERALQFRIYYLPMIAFYLGKQVKGKRKF